VYTHKRQKNTLFLFPFLYLHDEKIDVADRRIAKEKRVLVARLVDLHPRVHRAVQERAQFIRLD
jgi:hypothetical protein